MWGYYFERSFPRLFLIASDKEADVSSLLSEGGEGPVQEWNITSSKDLHDWEVGEVATFLDLLQNNIPRDWGGHHGVEMG